ncbi:MAG: Fe-S protein assembly co-chaperone HscB [Chloroherpetonaceae bacterium]|nr:Fe-S protein assembly co-chaperone HscB [Chloroherpetonaceae bacterium]MCS7210519.1 Fe-S protein assembly co-chaperone HscB [Chloroherpetonaceae bacterium]MDW8018618.1 Fe-S protein assembly co-chaperone HscB [Chloroherpetonaceae bacterium]MDW8467382.1 Fe-S protein assembly co-chaperone HscB [Chloroherpetonaceae bacterium]
MTQKKNYFELFGLPETLNLDVKELQKRFYALSRAVHPDFHQTATEAQKTLSLDASSELNQAFLTLKDREKRLHYVINTYLGELSDAEKKQTPSELLMQLMEIREKLEDFKHRKDDATRIDLQREVQALRNEQQRIDEAINNLMTQFDQATTEETKRQVLAQIRKWLLKKNYLRSLASSIESELNPSEV